MKKVKRKVWFGEFIGCSVDEETFNKVAQLSEKMKKKKSLLLREFWDDFIKRNYDLLEKQ